MHRPVDLQSGEIDVDRLRNGVGQAKHLDRVLDDVDGAAALHARRLVGVLDVDRDAHADAGAFAEAEKIDVDRNVAHRIELIIAGNDPVARAVDLELVDRGEEMPGKDVLPQLLEIERDRQRGCSVAVDHAGHAAFAPHRPGRSRSGPRPRRRLERLDFRHGVDPRRSWPMAMQTAANAAVAAAGRNGTVPRSGSL